MGAIKMHRITIDLRGLGLPMLGVMGSSETVFRSDKKEDLRRNL